MHHDVGTVMMMKRVVRVLTVGIASVATVTCADHATTVGRTSYARVALAPVWDVAPPGGPSIIVGKVSGVLKSGNDSIIASDTVVGDSAVLEFTNVVVHGDSDSYDLRVKAFDKTNTLVFTGAQDVHVKPGENPPITPSLTYAAPDTSVATIDISVASLALSWAGGDTASSVNKACLNKAASPSTSNTKQKLSVTGKTAANVTVSNVRVGWTSTDTSVFTVDTSGTVRSRCKNKSASLIARTFKDKADTILVTVTAPAFALIMRPDSINVARGANVTDTAFIIDETGNRTAATSAAWFSSDTSRAKVNSSGLVTAGNVNGRVLITAQVSGRTTVGVIQVVRPNATSVKVLPVIALDSLGVGQSRTYFGKALDAANKVIPDASGFAWSSSNASVITVDATKGTATAAGVGIAYVRASLDGKLDSIRVQVLTLMPAGFIKSKITDAATGAALAGVDVRSSASNFTTTAADGSFILGGLQNGDDIAVTKSGYKPDTAYYVPVFPNKTLDVPAFSLSPIGSPSTVTGKVVNAVTASVISGVTVEAYTGINGGKTAKRPNATPMATATTNASGNFTFSGNLPAGIYTFIAKNAGYSDQFAGGNSVAGQSKTLNDILMPPTAVFSGLYIVLTWADCPATNVPCDLDAHLTGPTVPPDTAGRFQVFHGNLKYTSGVDTIAALDVDDSNGRGPEVVSLRPAAPVGTYKFYVHNATAGTTPNKALADSASARVDVYQNGSLIGTFFPPAGVSGTVWSVFDYDGARLIPTGTITTEPNPAILSLRAAPTATPDKKRKLILY